MTLFDVIKQAALENESTAYCLRNEKQLLCVSGDSNAWMMKEHKIVRKENIYKIIDPKNYVP